MVVSAPVAECVSNMGVRIILRLGLLEDVLLGVVGVAPAALERPDQDGALSLVDLHRPDPTNQFRGVVLDGI